MEETHKIAQPIGYFSEVIPSELIDLICKEVENIQVNKYAEAYVGSLEDSEIDMKVRNSKISWWYEDHWVSSIFSHYINKANRDLWEYDLNFLSGIQVTTYEKGDHYTWHSDYGVSPDERYTRKLSASLLITDPADYRGGDLEIIDYHGNTIKTPKKRGTIIIFDSRIPHRVTEITDGKRVSLVTWMQGPKLR